MLIGYARVSTLDQNPQHQIDALNEAGCKKIFTEKISGASKKRKQLQEALYGHVANSSISDTNFMLIS